MRNRSDHPRNTSNTTRCRDENGSAPKASEWTDIFREMRDRLDRARPNVGRAEGPADLAMTVVAEALAIGEAISCMADTTDPDLTTEGESTAIYAGIDGRFLDHRARALRSALHSIDDYIWWGGFNERHEVAAGE